MRVLSSSMQSPEPLRGVTRTHLRIGRSPRLAEEVSSAGRSKPNESRQCKRLRRRWTAFGSGVRVAWLLVEIGDAGNAIRPTELPTRKACGFRRAGAQNGATGLHSSPIASDFDVRRGSDPRLDGHLQWLEKMCEQVRGRPVDAARSRNQGIADFEHAFQTDRPVRSDGRQAILETTAVTERLEKVLGLIGSEISVLHE